MINKEINSFFKSPIVSYSRVSGGDISDAYKVDTKDGQSFFIKLNQNPIALEMFQKEAIGLQRIEYAIASSTPKIEGLGKLERGSFLILEYKKQISWDRSSQSQLGEMLAYLHRNSSEYFGLDHNNFIATLGQDNTQYERFVPFFLERRILPLIRQAIDLQYLSITYHNWPELVSTKLENIIPKEPPALLHGDLWGGNVINTEDGPTFIDPAIYFGHREIDLAMTTMFGGFSPAFYEAYNNNFPWEPGIEERRQLFQLYPYLVHLILFGSAYEVNTRRILDLYQ